MPAASATCTLDRRPQPPEPRPRHARRPQPRDQRAVFARPRLAGVEVQVRPPSCEAAFDALDGGETLRRRIDEMPNTEYQSLLRQPGAVARARLRRGRRARRPAWRCATCSTHYSDEALPDLVGDLGGHDLGDILAALERVRRARPAAPSVIFAYTIKGCGLPIAGHPLNHSAVLTRRADRRAAPARSPTRGDEWAGFAAGHARGATLPAAAARLVRESATGRAPLLDPRGRPDRARPDAACRPTSTQEAFARTLVELARVRGRRASTSSRPAPTSRSRPASAAGSTATGVFAPDGRARRTSRRGARLLRWAPGPDGPAHRARHQRDEPVRAARPARPRSGAARASSCCRSAPSTTRSSAAGSTRSSTRVYNGAQLRLRRHAERASRCRARAARTSRRSRRRSAPSCPACASTSRASRSRSEWVLLDAPAARLRPSRRRVGATCASRPRRSTRSARRRSSSARAARRCARACSPAPTGSPSRRPASTAGGS